MSQVEMLSPSREEGAATDGGVDEPVFNPDDIEACRY